MKKFLRVAVKSILILMASGVLALLGFREWCAYQLPKKQRAVYDAWATVAVPLDEIPKRFPKIDPNSSAVGLDELTVKLGICLIPENVCDKSQAFKAAHAELETFKQEGDEPGVLSSYLNEQMEKPNREITPPPEKLQNFLSAHGDEILAVAHHLSNHELPQWPYETVVNDDISADRDKKGYQYAGHIDLAKILAAAGLAHLQAGKVSEGQLLLDGLWKLGESAQARPELIGAFIAQPERRMALALIRKMPGPSLEWEAKLSVFNARPTIRLVFEHEEWILINPETWDKFEKFDNQTEKYLASPGWRQRLTNALVRPWLRLSMLEYSDAKRRNILSQDNPDPCEAAKSANFTANNPALSWWNGYGKIIYGIITPNMNAIWKRQARVSLEVEMTRKLLALRAARYTDPNHAWPSTVGGVSDSACKQAQWEYHVNPDGTMQLNFSQAMDWGGMRGAKIPLQFSE